MRYTEDDRDEPGMEPQPASEHDLIAKDDLDMPTSKRTTSPAFQFYPKEFLSSTKVIAMTATERGIYITLLSMQWLDGSLPDDLPTLARLTGINVKAFLRMWPHNLARCFTAKNGRLVNLRLERERKKQADFRRKQTDNAAKGWESRRNAVAVPPHPSGNALQFAVSDLRSPISDLQSADSQKATEFSKAQKAPCDVPQDTWLRELQAAYPPQRVTYGYRTETAWCQVFIEDLRPAAEIWAELRANLEQHTRSHEWRVKGMVPALEKWLREGLWKRQMDEAAPAGDQVSPRTLRMLGGA